MKKRPTVPKRLMRGPADIQAVEEGCWYSKELADHAVAFFNNFLSHSKGEWAGKSFELLDWQEWDVVRPLFGWVRKDGTRRFRRAYIEVPKKNGKSTLSSGIALYLLHADGEHGAEVYSAAADRDQAAIVFNEAANMVKASAALKESLVITDSKKTITDPDTASVYKALSADAPTKEGLNIHGLIFDELHAQPNRVLWDTLKYGGAARRQPLFVSITTAGSDRNGICYEQHKYTKRVLEGGVRDTQFFGIIFAAEEGDDWEDPATWRKANPSFGITIKEDQFKADFLEAKETVGSQNSFRRYRLNQWVQQEVRWLDMAQWRLCVKPVPELKRQDLFFGGLDMASTQDITAFVQLFYDKDFYIRPHFFIPEDQLRRRVEKDRVPYDVWQRQGFLTVTRGNMVDEDHVVETILKLCALNKCREIAYDRWNASHVVTRLQDEGLTMVPVGQGFASMSYPSKELEKKVIGASINHAGNPVLEWMAGNTATETDAAENIKPSKKMSRERIDGMVATIMAFNRYLVHNNPKKSKYETQDPITVGKAPDRQGARIIA
jgi:phage terminase large subunit-like protein